MESSKWQPTKDDREVMEAVWMQVKGACEKSMERLSDNSGAIWTFGVITITALSILKYLSGR